ncbi:SDR family oxidoreductase [Jatrophihabitans sp.]|uniref:SDR family oxidoreductase n=1 Tax=Jatrophihabitans sp. TaxID=1932789 RepID=UPI003F801318
MTRPAPALLITGATGGIGAATARAARAAGWRLVLLARSAAVEALAGELGGDTVARAVVGDVTDPAVLERAVTIAVDDFEGLDAAFANAGMTAGPRQYRPGAAEASVDGWRDMVLTNVLGVALTVRAAAEALIASRGRLVITGSVLGRYAMASSFYSATKHAVAGIAETARLELLGTGVGVTLIAPGPVATTFTGASATANGGATLTSEDVARTVLFALDQPVGVEINEILFRPHGATP